MATLEPLTDATLQVFATEIGITSQLVLGRTLVAGPTTLVLPPEWTLCSGRHCKIWNQKGTWFISDMSRNGTHVDSEQLGKDDKRELKGGEELEISKPSTKAPDAIHVKWRFHINPNPPAPAPAAEAAAAVAPTVELKRKSSGSQHPQPKKPRPSSGDTNSINFRLRKDLQDSIEENGKLQLKVTQQGERIEQLTEELEDARTQRQEALDKVKEANAADELRSELEVSRGEVGRLQEAMEALESQKQAFEAEAKALKTKLDAERRDREAECGILGAAKDRLAAALQQEEAKCRNAQADLREAGKRTRNLERKCGELEQSVKAAQNRENLAKMSLASNENNIAELQEAIANRHKVDAEINAQRAQEVKDLEAELEARYKAEKAKAISELDARLESRRGESRAHIEELLWRAQGCDAAGGEQQATQLQDEDECMGVEEGVADGDDREPTQLVAAKPAASATISSARKASGDCADTGERAATEAATPSSTRRVASAAVSPGSVRRRLAPLNSPEALDTEASRKGQDGLGVAHDTAQASHASIDDAETDKEGDANDGESTPPSTPPGARMLGSPKENRPPESGHKNSESQGLFLVNTSGKAAREDAQESQPKVLGSHRQQLDGSLADGREASGSSEHSGEVDGDVSGSGVDSEAGPTSGFRASLIGGQPASEILE